MRIDRTIIKSKVGRRTLRLFVSSALVPILALAIIAFGRVSKQLEEQTHRRLHQMSKATAMTVAERLVKVETALRAFAAEVERGFSPADPPPAGAELHSYVRNLTVIMRDGLRVPVLGDVLEVPQLSHGENSHLASGRTVVRTLPGSDDACVQVIVELSNDASNAALIVAEIEPAFMWDELGTRSPVTVANTCILGPNGELLYASHDDTPKLLETFKNVDSSSAHAGEFEWESGGHHYLAGYWSVFLKSMYYMPQWTAVLSESKADALAPMVDFKRTFPFVALVSVTFVLVLSLVQIRRSLVPLGQLQEATERLASGDLDTRVDVTSGDEFETLGAAFNSMAHRLANQFKMLKTIAKIDRVLLSSLDQKTIIETVLREVPMAFPCEAIMLSLLQDDTPGERTAFIRFGRERFNGVVNLTKADIEALYDNPQYVTATSDRNPPAYLSPLMMQGLCCCVVLPIFLKSQLSGFVALGQLEDGTLAQDDLPRARQLVDQVGVALTNARLVTELDTLNVGALAALGRAIDAKSPWTQGHSERVTQMAVKVGRKLGMEKKDLEVFYRAGLLHDIGKIAVPQALLDKPGPLTAEEMAIVREHVRHGGRILEPIGAFKEMMPIIMQHHERWDGEGYPEGLAGEAIDLGARVFAVADCYDAIASDRPYRPAMDMGQVYRIIREGSGKAFDPRVVDAFFEVMAEEHHAAKPETDEAPVR